MKAAVLLLYLTLAAIPLIRCDAERSRRLFKGPNQGRILTYKYPKKFRMIFKHFDLNSALDSSYAQTYSISSPNSLPPYEFLPPISLPENSPPFCLYPPKLPPPPPPPSNSPGSLPTPTIESIPSPPSIIPGSPKTIQNPPIIITGPSGPSMSPPRSLPTLTPLENVPNSPSNLPGSPETIQNPPIIIPSPPGSLPTPTSPESVPNSPSNIPGSPEPIQNPPIIIPGPPGSSMSPPYFEPNPPSTNPSPTGGTVPSPTVFEPPIVYPPPSVPPPPFYPAPSGALWCVAKPSVPDPIIQEAMNYACGSGAECDSIQPNGPCFEPNTVLAHASYAFNSFWQSTKVTGGTCDFGGTGMLVKNDPSYDGCHFVYN